jgi:hypothetical protein
MQTLQVIFDPAVGKVHKEATTSRGKRSKPDEYMDMFLDPEINMEVYIDEDYNVNPFQSTINRKQKLTSKKSAKGKKQGKKSTHVPKYPRRNSTRVVKKFRLNSKAMFDPSIKKKNLIVIEDNSEDSKTNLKEKEDIHLLHKNEKENKKLGKTQGKGKQVSQYSIRPITRVVTRSSKFEAVFKGIGGVFDDKQYHSTDPDQILDLPEAEDSNSSNNDHSSEYLLDTRSN